MSVYTDYDRLCDELKEDLKECLKKAKRLTVDDSIWCYDQVRDDYMINIFMGIKDVINKM